MLQPPHLPVSRPTVRRSGRCGRCRRWRVGRSGHTCTLPVMHAGGAGVGPGLGRQADHRRTLIAAGRVLHAAQCRRAGGRRGLLAGAGCWGALQGQQDSNATPPVLLLRSEQRLCKWLHTCWLPPTSARVGVNPWSVGCHRHPRPTPAPLQPTLRGHIFCNTARISVLIMDSGVARLAACA